ncbi:MAG: nucleotide-binding protein [Candidatus Poribacteria bacterium]|nr:nucleotide-binding protein [Candidatus Poribacteria bacterium]
MLQLKIVLYPDFMLVLFLLIPDNVGAFKNEADRQLNHRAHQNIIFELGYFIGKLNPNQVCLLYKEGVELPSDIRDVAYVPMDSADDWKLKLSRGMRKAELPVDMSQV